MGLYSASSRSYEGSDTDAERWLYGWHGNWRFSQRWLQHKLFTLHANFFGGVELDTWETEIVSYSAALAQAKQYSAQAYLDMTAADGAELEGNRIQPDCLIGTAYDETVMIPKHHQDNELTAIALVYIYKLLLAYSFGNYTAALDYIAQAKQYLMAVSGLVSVPIFHFYAALTHLALFPTQPETEQAEILA